MPEFTLKVRRYQPESGEGRLLGGVQGRPRPVALRPRRAPPGQGPRGRLARRPLLVPRGDLRLLRDEDQRLVDSRLQDADRRGARGREPPQRRRARTPSRRGRRAAARSRRGFNNRCHRWLWREPDRGRADGEHAGDQGPGHRYGVDPLGEDPPRHPVAAAGRRPARARVHRPARVDGRRHPVDRLHPVRRLRLLMPLDGGRPRLHRARRARQGLPLRRRPARRGDQGAPLRPRPGPARDLRLHALLRVHRRLPQGRRPDEPDHAAAPRRGRTRASTTPTTATTTRTPSPGSSRRRARSTSRCCSRSPTPRASRAS